jgi:dynein heavy chain
MWYEKERPEEEVIPCGYNSSLDVFRKLLLIRSWSPDRTLSQARKYIMGESSQYVGASHIHKLHEKGKNLCFSLQ